LATTYTHDSFEQAMEFLANAAFYCQLLDHHPSWTNSYTTVSVELWTHDRGGVTGFDLRLAELLDMEFEQLTARGHRQS
jgi:4a-hydroxytetrahydrobiopterin dehydratase